MSSLAHRYEDFGTPSDSKAPADDVVLDDAEEEAQLTAFENGYQAGWEDATKVLQGDSDYAVLGIAQHLQDMSFTHREAVTHLNASLQPLMRQIIDKLLPQIARPIVGAQILEQVAQLIDDQLENAIEIAVSPENLEDLRDMLKEQPIGPFSFSADSMLEHGQAYLRVNQSEREINFDAVLAGISEAFDAFYDQIKESPQNG